MTATALAIPPAIRNAPPSVRVAWLRQSRAQTMRIKLPALHAAQQQIVDEAARFNVLACGRRFGKSHLLSNRLMTVSAETAQPVGWFSPTYKMMLEVWREVIGYLQPWTVKRNATEMRIELSTGGVFEFWSLDNHDAARGRKYAAIAVDEAAMVRQLSEAWIKVLRPTLIDYQGGAWFGSTPRGANYFKTLYDFGQRDDMSQWASWQMPTWSNPFISQSEIDAARLEMPPRAFQQEIAALFLEDVEGALWSQATIDRTRATNRPKLTRIVTAIDPAATTGETGIVTAGIDRDDVVYILSDDTTTADPATWAAAAVAAASRHGADRIVYESNQGGDMVAHTIRTVDRNAALKSVRAARGKVSRAEPVAALYEQGRVKHVGFFDDLEQQMTTYIAGEKSPDRMDAMVWAVTELLDLDTSREPTFRTLGSATLEGDPWYEDAFEDNW